MGIARDITERKKMVQALAENEKKYHMLADNASDVIFIFGLDFKYRYVSPSVKKVRGYSPEELIGQPVGFYINSGNLEQIKNTMNEELEKDRTGKEDPDRTRMVEVEMSCKNGSKIWAEVKVQALRNEKGEPTEILGISRDITKRKLIEDALRESEEKYRVLVEQANEAITIIQDDIYVFCNKKAADTLGISRDDIIGKSYLEFIYSDDRDLVEKNYKNRLSGSAVPKYDFRITGPEGRTSWVSLSGTTIQFRGKPATLALMTDITERKKVEEEREKLILELKDALSNVKILSGLLPICASCKKIRNDKGYWEQIEMYVKNHSEADFSHGLCPDCARKLYPDFYYK